VKLIINAILFLQFVEQTLRDLNLMITALFLKYELLLISFIYSQKDRRPRCCCCPQESCQEGRWLKEGQEDRQESRRLQEGQKDRQEVHQEGCHQENRQEVRNRSLTKFVRLIITNFKQTKIPLLMLILNTIYSCL